MASRFLTGRSRPLMCLNRCARLPFLERQTGRQTRQHPGSSPYRRHKPTLRFDVELLEVKALPKKRKGKKKKKKRAPKKDEL